MKSTFGCLKNKITIHADITKPIEDEWEMNQYASKNNVLKTSQDHPSRTAFTIQWKYAINTK